MSAVTKAYRMSSVMRVPRGAANDGVHRMRIPHGDGEIELVIQLNTSGEVGVSVAPPLPQAVPFVLAPGGKLGKYVLEDKLGQGTFGTVYTALDPELDRRVAIKILNPSHQLNSDVLHRFLQEARASARIGHPGIVTVLDCGRVAAMHGEVAYIVFELLQGEHLASRLVRAGRLAPASASELVRQIASALDAAHRAGVLHRDLKPENIHLVPDPAAQSGERVKVLDFGLAKLGASQHTSMGTVFGTPRYMSPEQCRSSTAVDHRSDIYSLGCVLFELVTGSTPFQGELRQQLESHQRLLAPRASTFATITPALDELIAQMLAKDPAARPQSMAAIQLALQGDGGASMYAPGSYAQPAGNVAATLLPIPAQVIALAPLRPPPSPAPLALPPPTQGFGYDEIGPSIEAPVYPPPREQWRAFPDKAPAAPVIVRRSRVRGGFVTAAMVMVIAGALAAVASRGHMRNASAIATQPAGQSID